MIYAFIRGFIGGIGRAIMDFYIANSLVINATILIYALLVYFAHLSYYAAYKSVLEMLDYKTDKPSRAQKDKILKGNVKFSELDWDTVRRSFWFPFIAAPRALLIRPKTNSMLQRMFNEGKIKELLSSEK